jgi:pSer/pThr/pTyr-binding forkhead associated (FHA) protein
LSSAYGLQISRTGRAVRIVGLSQGEHIVGRSLTSSVVLSDHGISRQHLRLVVQSDIVMIEDMNSGNGTFVDGERLLSPSILKYGAEVTLGLFTITLTAISAVKKPEEMAWLEVVGIGVGNRSHSISLDGVTIGRSISRDIVLNDSTVSRAHCEIVYRDETWWIIDNASANGISLNGEPTTSARLKSGDDVCVGSVALRFMCEVPLDNQETIITQRVEPKGDLVDCVTEEWPEPTVNEPKGSLLPTVLLWTFVVCVLVFSAVLAVMFLVPEGSIGKFFV